MAVQTNIAAGYLSAFEGPIGVSVQSKLKKWPFLQKLGFAGSLSYSNSTFHGLKDFTKEMKMYSVTHPILRSAWRVIEQIAPLNPEVTSQLFTSDTLGPVGKDFENLTGFGEAFAVSPDQLKSPSAIRTQVSASGPISPSITNTAGI